MDLNMLYYEILEDGGDIFIEKCDDIKCPTLIIHGTEDGVIPNSHAIFLKDNIEGSE